MSAVVLTCPLADRPSSRPLPSIPTSQLFASQASKARPLLQNHYHHATSKSGPSTSRSSSAPLSGMYRYTSSRVALGSLLQEPRILANFLRYVHWDDFHSLALTCTACINVLERPKLRDVILSAFVPGYSYCLRHADVDILPSIVIQFSDLGNFMNSQRLPLHHYSAHALATFSAECGITDLEQKIQRYVVLCQAHSRMVLHLQALIHSSLSPVSEEWEDPSLLYRNAQQGVRELVFPAPLSFVSSDGASKNHAPQQMSRGHTRSLSTPTAPERLHRKGGEPPRRTPSRVSILGRNKVPPPPPSADPLSLKIYSGSWRCRRRTPTSPSPTSDDDRTPFRRPKPNFGPTTDSSGSSTDNGRGSPSRHSTGPAEFLPNPLSSSAPHDIRAAVSRLRAPILRVYFPCSEVDDQTIAACEAQLDDAGLWQHLSVGDIVCNLGYLPPIEGEGSSNSSELLYDTTLGPESWMIFDGMGLLPYTTSAVLPLSEPLSLPSPFYYAHITFPPINPRFISALPHEEPELSLAFLPVNVRSVHSPSGFVRVRKYLWLARLRPHVRPGLGERWHCEWVLEGEGTKEGRQSLLGALSGNASTEWEWELVMERCTATRIWLRPISTMRVF